MTNSQGPYIVSSASGELVTEQQGGGTAAGYAYASSTKHFKNLKKGDVVALTTYSGGSTIDYVIVYLGS